MLTVTPTGIVTPFRRRRFCSAYAPSPAGGVNGTERVRKFSRKLRFALVTRSAENYAGHEAEKLFAVRATT